MNFHQDHATNNERFLRGQVLQIQVCIYRVQEGLEDSFLKFAKVSKESRLAWLGQELDRLQEELAQELASYLILPECDL